MSYWNIHNRETRQLAYEIKIAQQRRRNAFKIIAECDAKIADLKEIMNEKLDVVRAQRHPVRHRRIKSHSSPA